MNKVELEFKRIQTYLFASPRLRAMLGANASLGRTIRIELPKIARDCGAVANPQIAEKMPSMATEDPLAHAALENQGQVALADDPAQVYREYGVLVRDGGHFIATFPDSNKARTFIKRATECITKVLPGILLEARVDGDKVQQVSMGESLFQHPGFQVSQHLGNQPAERRGAKAAFVSTEERMMEDQGKSFRDHPTDLIAMLENNRLIPCAEEPPQDLGELVEDDYLALIHADGNSIGQRYQGWRKNFSNDHKQDGSLEAEAHGERFYHSMRVSVRVALTEALNKVFQNAPTRYQLLMLGGDDLLLACAARYALPFAQAYAEALSHLKLCDGQPLTIGTGIIIAKKTFPFHRLHAMAETLADSAKQRYRADPSLGSVVDWHVTSSSWVDDPIAERRADRLSANAVLSGKPYPILGPNSLETLLKAAAEIGDSANVARSQLRSLVETMRQGPGLAELAWHELPHTMRPLLDSALSSFGQKGLFHPACGTLQTSILPDLVELIEIDRQQCRLSQEQAA